MKEKFINWLISKLITGEEDYSTQSLMLVKLKGIIKELMPTYIAVYEFEREVYRIIFDEKYRDQPDLGKDTPYETLQKYYVLANKGDNSFMTAEFYRTLRRHKDKEINKLKYRLKRNVN